MPIRHWKLSKRITRNNFKRKQKNPNCNQTQLHDKAIPSPSPSMVPSVYRNPPICVTTLLFLSYSSSKCWHFRDGLSLFYLRLGVSKQRLLHYINIFWYWGQFSFRTINGIMCSWITISTLLSDLDGD